MIHVFALQIGLGRTGLPGKKFGMAVINKFQPSDLYLANLQILSELRSPDADWRTLGTKYIPGMHIG